MAAGQGFKTFTTGEVLTAADTNGYLMQGVLVFADAAARSAAITSPQEGQTSYLKDTDEIQVYSGSAWVTKSGSLPSQTGNAGKYLTTDGSNASWDTVSSGGMTLISTTTLTGASVSLTSIPATYNNLQIIIRNYLPNTDAESIRMTVNSTSSIYRTPNTLPEAANQAASSTYIINGDADNAVSTGSSIITIFDYANTNTIKLSTIVSAVNNSTTSTNFNLKFNMGIIGTTSAISSIQFVTGSGNFTSGTVLLYGVK